MTLTDLVKRVQRAFADNPDRSFTARQMYRYLGEHKDHEKAAIRQILIDMEAQGLLKDVKDGKYRLSDKQQANSTPKNTETSDIAAIVGTLILTNTGGIVCSLNDKQIRDNIIIRAANLNGAADGDKVVVELTRNGTARRLPEGRIVDVLGQAGDNDTEMHAILSEYGLPYSYPEELEQAASYIEAGITEKEIERRHDMRERLCFTIDPADAKDFDDALSFEAQTDNEGKPVYEVGIHIADVTHYVMPGTPLDKEAYHRGTSVYLVDRTVPMLPEHLSNGICSLRPDEDKLCFSVVFLIDDTARVKSYKIEQTVIRSCRRYNYEEVQNILDEHSAASDEATAKNTEPLTFALLTLNRLAGIMRQQRFEHGAINFEREEMRFRLDEKGKPIGVYTHHATQANNLIEEFMLLANRTVAEHVNRKSENDDKQTSNREFIYRIHDLPDPEKLLSLSKFVRRFGYNMKPSSRSTSTAKQMNKLLKDISGKPEQNLVETLTLRSMAKAAYSTDNIGHYGLAFRFYTHFTSPIRRYPDMIAHRLLKQYVLGSKRCNPAPYEHELEDACTHCSDREQLAATAERASIKYKQAEYMQDKIGQVFDGHISGVTEHGIFVELDDTHCEGFVPIRFLFPNDFAVFNEDEYCITGERTGKSLRLGDALKVSIVSTDLIRKQIDMALAD
ncbi:MAG: ribonuclease R [Paludibacteraceae bacterium]|nr:ribonuclease R [Paludibacteraceae bacterium]